MSAPTPEKLTHIPEAESLQPQANADDVIDVRDVIDLRNDILRAESEQELALRDVEKARVGSAVFQQLLHKQLWVSPVAYDVPSPDAQEVTPVGSREAVRLIEERGFVREAPRFADQLTDTTRTTPFRYYTGESIKPLRDARKTEYQGITELHSFLKMFLQIVGTQPGEIPTHETSLLNQAASMLENLTFIGEKEYNEAVNGIGALWKSYLDSDPNMQLCLLANVRELDRYASRTRRKSDEYLREKILDTFSAKEIARYGKRIVDNVGDLNDPAHAKIIIVDDWTISGTQIRDVYRNFLSHPAMSSYVENDAIEVNLLVASEGRLEHGLALNEHQPALGTLKVNAYFKSHFAESAQTANKGHVTGLHSAVNYDFYEPCNDMHKILKDYGSEPPALTRVLSPYKEKGSKPVYSFEGGTLKKGPANGKARRG